MKIIHAADIHLGSKLNSKYPKLISDERKLELRKTFERMIEYAKNHEVKVIILAGDIFDKDNPSVKDKSYFYGVIENNPDIDFLYLRGNHDIDGENEPKTSNLKCFSDEWTSYNYGDIRITGIERNERNVNSLYASLDLSKEQKNIVVLHGPIGTSKQDIDLRKLRDKSINYLALGHIHSYSSQKLDEKGVCVYSGCLEPRGFDEIGEKGFVLLDIIDSKITYDFIPFSSRVIHEEQVDISHTKDAVSISEKIKEISFVSKDLYRIKLIGEVDIDVSDLMDDIYKLIEHKAYFIDLKNETTPIIDYNAYTNDVSLKGEFVRLVQNNPKYSDDEKARIIMLGIRALEGKEIE